MQAQRKQEPINRVWKLFQVFRCYNRWSDGRIGSGAGGGPSRGVAEVGRDMAEEGGGAGRVWNVHLDALDLDAPLLGGVVEDLLHARRDHLALGQDLRERLRAEHVAQRRLRQ